MAHRTVLLCTYFYVFEAVIKMQLYPFDESVTTITIINGALMIQFFPLEH